MQAQPRQLSEAEYAALLRFPFAEQADIIRAAQKDEYYKHVLNTNTFDVVRQALGPLLAMNWKEEIHLAAEILSYLLTTLIDRQTLGEEYCDIMQVSESRLTTLYPKERVFLLLLHILVPYFLNKVLQKLKELAQPSFSLKPPITEENRKRLERYLPSVTAFIDIVKRLHVAIFYFSGSFYDISKRILGIRYIFNRKLEEERPQYTILGLLIFVQVGISLIIFMKQTIRSFSSQTKAIKKQDEDDVGALKASDLCSTTGKCSLCMEVRQNPTATSCGHLFCWECITEWCNTKSECPLCRRPQKKSQLACVYGI